MRGVEWRPLLTDIVLAADTTEALLMGCVCVQQNGKVESGNASTKVHERLFAPLFHDGVVQPCQTSAMFRL